MTNKFKAVPVDGSALHGRITFPLVFSVLAAGLGSSFIFGYNIGVINSAGSVIKRWIAENNNMYPINFKENPAAFNDELFLSNLTDSEQATVTDYFTWAVSVFPLGGMIGGLSTGFVADKFGRKGGMLMNNLLTFAAGILMTLAKPLNAAFLLIIGRFLIGINCGLNSGLAPMYLTEISPVNYRGLLGSVCQLMVTFSILVSNILGLDSLLGTHQAWPYLFAFTMVPSIYQLLTMPFCPESPKYLLIAKGRHDDARNALVKLRQTNDVDNEINAMQAEAEKLRESPKVTLGQILSNPITRFALFIAVMMMLSQQLSGINAAMFYSTSILQKGANLSTYAATMATIGVMLVNVLMTVVSTAIVDKAGRRTLHMIGLAGMFFSTILLTFSMLNSHTYAFAGYAAILFLVLFVIFFASGPGSVPWFYVSECFEQGARGTANSIAVGVNWMATWFVGYMFPHLEKWIEAKSFLFFTFFLGFFWFFTWKWVPETKGKTVEQVQNEMRRK